MHLDEVPQAVYQFDLPQLMRCEALGGAGGFSGARFWRLHTVDGKEVCVRCWPSCSDAARIEAIHDVLGHAALAGCDFLAVPLKTRDARTVVKCDGRYWEIARWLPGRADFHEHPTESRLKSVVQALASFHLATESLAEANHRDAPPAVVARLARIEQLQAGLGDEIRVQARRPHPAMRTDETRLIVETYERRRDRVKAALHEVLSPVCLTACLRDVWHDHVLFTGDRVSGVVDYDAIRQDCVSTDLSRILGSLVGGDRRRWVPALEAYDRERALSAEERAAVFALDEANAVLTGMQWLEWLYVRKIAFENMAMVRRRVEAAVQRLTETDFET